jgi:hypothetical protein
LRNEFTLNPTKRNSLCFIHSFKRLFYVFEENTVLPRFAHPVSQRSLQKKLQRAVYEWHEPHQYFYVSFCFGGAVDSVFKAVIETVLGL